MQVMMFAAPAYFAGSEGIAPDLQRLLLWASWLLSIPVVLFAAAPMFREAWAALRARRIGMDLPVAVGIAVTFVASSGVAFDPGGVFGREAYFDSLTMFVTFLLGGRYLAVRLQSRVAETLEGALDRLPSSVRRIESDGRITLVGLDALRCGDRVQVPVGEAFPVDGPILDGTTAVDESLLTGESRPIAKGPGDQAIAGSLNLRAPVLQRVERLGADTRYAGIVVLMRDALSRRPPLLRSADRVAGPLATPPLVVNCDPWHGQTNWLPEKPVMVHDSCVQMAESTLKVSCAVCATRNVPSEVWRIAAEPTDASAPAGSIETETVRPLTLPETVLSGVALDGEVGLPPQAVNTPAASSEAPRAASIISSSSKRFSCTGGTSGCTM